MPDAVFAIPVRVRRAVLNTLHDHRVRRADLIWDLGKRFGFSNLGEFAEFVAARYGPDAARQVVGRLDEDTFYRHAGELSVPPAVDGITALGDVADELLGAMPDELFIAAVESGTDMAVAYAFEVSLDTELRNKFDNAVTELFVTNGVPYHFDGGRLVPSLSPTVGSTSIQPAADVLGDPRLTDGRAHFDEALRRLQEPDPEEAVDEARQAVEASMLALLDAHSIPRPDKHQPQDLFDALVPGVVQRSMEELVLATPRFRGRTRAGHAGRPPVTLDEAQAAVAAAAAAVLLLAGKLP